MTDILANLCRCMDYFLQRYLIRCRDLGDLRMQVYHLMLYVQFDCLLPRIDSQGVLSNGYCDSNLDAPTVVVRGC